MGSVVIEPNGEYVDGEMYPSDLFEIHVVGTVVTYLQNGVLVYTSLKTPTFPLLVDTALYKTGSAVKNVAIRCM
jgi:hypothetical protein